MSTANNDCNLQSIVLQLLQQNNLLTEQTNQLIQQNNQLIQINSDQTAQLRMLLDEITGDDDEPQCRNLDDD
ncbi:hypothetical protein E0H77_00595 [Acinetobacter sp. ANC 4633]|uniref:hypothetical protein n=1 Tax=Acinetobacter sp. ANC 4633 TaxID=2529845 RepID=UPI0010409AB3|nr:hypothetical protein [Acinetobacter sp. ANC 4633]TCB28677.1 hypothetical protein E0H77_00595 [Acinetobacter sp. ANC 4633]